jgi:dipeptidase E
LKKLVLLSDLNNNVELEHRILEIINTKIPKLGYIPSCSDREKKYFNHAKPYFINIGFQDVLYYDVDEEYDTALTQELLQCDAIYLSGGNTFYFLNNLKKRNMLGLLRDFVGNGGVLIGASAGSILMLETIEIAKYIDENEINLKKLDALNLVDFNFMPHWEDEKTHVQDLIHFLKEQRKPIYTCKDGDGIVVLGDRLEFYGDVNAMKRIGKKI